MPNTLSVAAAIGALKDTNFLDASRRKNAATKSSLYQELQELDLPYIPTQTNFVYFKVPDFPAFKKYMNDNKVLIAGGWPSPPNWARVTLGKADEMRAFYALLQRGEW